jgi:hypothetical protein
MGLLVSRRRWNDTGGRRGARLGGADLIRRITGQRVDVGGKRDKEFSAKLSVEFPFSLTTGKILPDRTEICGSV